MKSIFAETAGSRWVNLKNNFPLLMLIAAVILTETVFFWFIWSTYLSGQNQNVFENQIVKAAKLQGSIITFDEILTMSAKMAAVTGDLRWEARYRRFEPQLIQSIEAAKNFAPDSQAGRSLAQTDEANFKLVEMENRAFDQVREGRAEKAREILFSDEYERQKDAYTEGIIAFNAELENYHKAKLSAARRFDNQSALAVIIIFIFSFLAWLATVVSLQKSRNNLLEVSAEKEKTEAALRKSEQYRNLFKHANDAILIFEPETEIILELNNEACEIYGRRREEFIGRCLTDMTQNVGRGTKELKELHYDGVYDEFESVHLRGDGTPINLIINAALIEYQEKPAIMTINRDVTARKLAEAALRESEEQFRSVTRSAQDAIVSADSGGNVIFWNERAREIFGYDEQEILGKSLQMIMPAAHRQAHQKGLERNVATGENHLIGKTIEVPGLRKNGSEFPMELSLGNWQSSKGKFFTAVIRDITDRKLTENAVIESEARYRLLGEGIMHQVWTSQPDGKLDYVNERTLGYFDFSMEEALNDGWMNVVHPEDVAKCVESWTRSKPARITKSNFA